jgi:DNA repair exonuclease SbcCD nuclease subunit
MKIAILGDTHFGMRGDSLAFHALYSKFYKEVFFPYLLNNGITTIFQLGDLFDRRKYISFQSLALCRKYFFDEISRYNLELHVLLGNHDITYRNTLEVNSPELLLQEYMNNVFIYNEPASWQGIDVIPWICKDNEKQISDYIYHSNNSVCFGHFELAGFEMDRGNFCHEGMDPSILRRYEVVLSGHFHHKSTQGNVTYVGTPGEMTWADYNDERGFHIFDTTTRELKFIPNPHRMFYKIKYNDDDMQYNEVAEADYSQYTGKQVKIVVEKRNNSFIFDTLIDCLTKANPMDVSVVEDFSDTILAPDDIKIDEAEDTISILDKYVDGLTLPVDSSKIKGILRDVYFEAMTAENS